VRCIHWWSSERIRDQRILFDKFIIELMKNQKLNFLGNFGRWMEEFGEYWENLRECVNLSRIGIRRNLD
jgi:hypothetical protein